MRAALRPKSQLGLSVCDARRRGPDSGSCNRLHSGRDPDRCAMSKDCGVLRICLCCQGVSESSVFFFPFRRLDKFPVKKIAFSRSLRVHTAQHS